jgi:serine/threonine protein kinase
MRRIGSGGMGIVYEALDSELGRRVAIKMLRPEVGRVDSTARTRMLREAQAMARLNHPNVVSVYDVGTFDDHTFIAMEYVEGRTLAAWMGEPRSWREVIDKFIHAAHGLAAAHSAGIVHRDFKPENVLLGDDGRVVVTDFGLARNTGRVDQDVLGEAVVDLLSAYVTRTGVMTGTPAYMPPEILEGRLPNARSDQFSFAVALHEALYHTHPFRGETNGSAVGMLCRITTGKVPPEPSGSTIPRPIRRALLRALSADPNQRFDSISDFIAVLEKTTRMQMQKSRRFIALFLLALIGTAAAALLSRPKGDQIGLQEERSVPPARPVSNTTQGPEPLVPAPAPQPVVDTSPAPLFVNLTIASDPAGAYVFSQPDGKALGRTPLLLRFPRGAEEIALELRHRGYAPAALRFVPEIDATKEIKLGRHHRPSRSLRRKSESPPAYNHPIGDKVYDPFDRRVME